MDRLKPCPFCGVVPIVKSYKEQMKQRTWSITCDNRDCKVFVGAIGYFEQDKMIEDWNRRSTNVCRHSN